MKIRELLSNETKWTKGANARNRSTCPCDPCSPDAVSWCLYGAFLACYRADEVEFPIDVLLRSEMGLVNAIKLNDEPTTTFEDIKVLVEKLDI